MCKRIAPLLQATTAAAQTSTPAAAGPNTGGEAAAAPSASQMALDVSNCPHHRSVLVQMSAIIQAAVLHCPTAVVWNFVSEGKVSSYLVGSPLDQLPIPPSALPMAPRFSNDHVSFFTFPLQSTRKPFLELDWTGQAVDKWKPFDVNRSSKLTPLLTSQVRELLREAEHRIKLRSRAAEKRWSLDKLCQLQHQPALPLPAASTGPGASPTKAVALQTVNTIFLWDDVPFAENEEQ